MQVATFEIHVYMRLGWSITLVWKWNNRQLQQPPLWRAGGKRSPRTPLLRQCLFFFFCFFFRLAQKINARGGRETEKLISVPFNSGSGVQPMRATTVDFTSFFLDEKGLVWSFPSAFVWFISRNNGSWAFWFFFFFFFFFLNKLVNIFSLSNGIFLSQNTLLEQLEVHTLPSRKPFFPCWIHFFFYSGE